MALDAGSVIASLGGRFSPAGFHLFGQAMYRARADMENGEKRMVASQSRVSRATAAMGTVAKGAAIGGIAALGYGLVKSVKLAADFEQQLSSLQSVTGASAKQMKALKQSALDAGAATKFSAQDAAVAQTELAKGGLSVAKILGGGLKAALALAAAGELDLGQAAATTVNAMQLFNLSGGQAMHVADALATAANKTTADVSDFALALTQGGSAAKAAGLSFDQTITWLEALAQAGIKGSDAGTSLKNATLQLLSPTKQQAAASKAAGLNFLDQHGNMKSLVDISAMLRDKTGDMTRAQRVNLLSTIAGTDGFRALLALYSQSPAQLRKLEAGLRKQGSAFDVAAKKQDNLKGKLENLKGSLETLGIIVGSKLIPPLTDAAVGVTKFLNGLSSGKGAGGAFAKAIVSGFSQIKSVVGDLRPTVSAIIGIFRAISPAIGDIFRSAIAVVKGAVGVFKGVIGAIAAVLHGDLSGALHALEGIFTSAFGAIKGVLGSFLSFAGHVGEAIGHVLSGPITAAAGLVKSGLAEVIHLYAGFLHGLASVFNLLGKIPGIGGAFRGIGKDIDSAADSLDGFVNKLRRVPRNIPSKVNLDAHQAMLNLTLLETFLGSLPKRVVTMIQASTQKARADLAAVVARLHQMGRDRTIVQILSNAPTTRVAIMALTAAIRGVPQSKIVSILHNAGSAKGAMDALRAAIDSLHDKTVTITTYEKVVHSVTNLVKTVKGGLAEGTRAGQAQTAMIGEGGGDEYVVNRKTGAGYKTGGPQFAALGPDDYVVPLEQRHRGRALGLFAALAKDLGVDGYAAGRKPKHKAKPKRRKSRYHPEHVDPIAFPLDTVNAAVNAADTRLGAAKTRAGTDRTRISTLEGQVRSLKGQIRTAQGSMKYQDHKSTAYKHNQDRIKTLKREIRKTDAEVKKAKAKVKRDETTIHRREADLKQRKKEAREARAFQARITKQETLADIAGDDMTHADNVNDPKAYERARGRRLAALRARMSLLKEMRRHAKFNPAFARSITALIHGAQVDVDDARSATIDLPEAAEATTYTPAEQAALDQLTGREALAEITPPTTDDVTAWRALLGFQQGVLGRLQAAPVKSWAAISEVAGAVKQAQDQITDLTAPGGGTDTTTPTVDVAAQTAAFNQAIFDARASFGSNFKPGTSVTQHIVMQRPPEDPHLWTRGVLHEITAMP